MSPRRPPPDEPPASPEAPSPDPPEAEAAGALAPDPPDAPPRSPVAPWRNVEIWPVLHGVLELAVALRQRLLTAPPACVAVELPETLQRAVLRGVDRLPYLSMVYYEGTAGPVYVPVEPTDAIMEALRFALERDLPLALVDRDVEQYPLLHQRVPDPYAIRRVGYRAYVQAYLDHPPPPDDAEWDEPLEGEPPAGDPAPAPEGDAGAAPGGIHLVSPDSQPAPGATQGTTEGTPDASASEDLAAARRATRFEEARRRAAAEDALREATMAYHLQQLSEAHESVVFVCGLDHAAGVRAALETPQVRPIGRLRRDGVLTYALDAEASREVTGETPYLMEAYETWRATDAAADPPDRAEAQLGLLQRARERHRENSREEVGLGPLATLRRFSRNYALVEGRLAPDFYQLLVASRGAVNDNYAYEVWDLGTAYAHQEKSPSLPTIAPSIEDLYRYSRTIRFHRTIKRRRRRLWSVAGERKREERPGQWKEQWNPGFICSHPPEDLVVESYGAFLMKKARKLLSEEASRTQPFSTSLLDGIDVRETVRNWHEGRIYVREHQPVRGRVGAVVMIFDPDDGPEPRYPWTLTWQGEHEQESDMAFYATAAGEQLVGPGISRCEYGGFLLSYPPGRMFSVWRDPFFNRARTKAERLLLAAIDYCLEPYIVYVAAEPPRAFLKTVAARFGHRIFYLPIGQLSPVTLRQVRVFHVLEGHHVREYAKDFIY